MLEQDLEYLGSDESLLQEDYSLAWDLYSRLIRVMYDEDDILVYEDDLKGEALGLSKYELVAIERTLDPVSKFSVLVHEYAHELLHWSPEEGARLDHTTRETHAPMVSFFVTSAFGFGNTNATAQYVALHGNSEGTITTDLQLIVDTSVKILGRLDPTHPYLDSLPRLVAELEK